MAKWANLEKEDGESLGRRMGKVVEEGGDS
jgi:hypothetical protein